MRLRLAIFVLALAPAVAALGWSVADGRDRSFAVYPKQEIPLRFDHELHDLECTDCHQVAQSTRSSDRNIPEEAVCAACHEIEVARQGGKTDPPATCETCHPGFDETAMAAPKPIVIPPPNLVFDHALHLDRGVPCVRCHADVREVQVATRAQLPRMETCLECHHDGGEATGACAACHPSGPDGRLRTWMSNGERLVPSLGNPFGIGHTAEYWRNHGSDARAAKATCYECHSEPECLVCHDGARKVLQVHPNDWITLHPVPAKHGALQCMSCHNEQQYCATCHERIGIGPQAAPQLRAKNLRVHPPASIWVDTPGPGHHGIWASRDIASCASCHREEGCIRCHASSTVSGGGFGRGGLGISPHPPGFRGQACSMLRKNARVCLKCHAPADPVLGACSR